MGRLAMDILRLGETADALGISRQKLQEFLVRHPVDDHGIPFFATIKGERLFTQEAVQRLRKAILDEKRDRATKAAPQPGHRDC